jgi:tryptophan synthase alpha chain
MKKLMTHVVAGCPGMQMCEKVLHTMLDTGSDFIEIQLPFTDPVADGEVMMKANQIALDNGTRIADCFDLAERITKYTDKPVYFMGYFNTIYKIGIAEFCKKSKAVGIKGLIFPDVTFDEALSEGLIDECKKNNLTFINVVSENISDERLNKLAKYASDFVYCTSRLGITGLHSEQSEQIVDYLRRIKKATNLPLAVGFGLSSKADIDLLPDEADIAVVGSHLMKMALDESRTEDERLASIRDFIKKVKS